MSIAPFLTADPIIQVHLMAALAAVFLGPINAFKLVRSVWHQRIGLIWMTTMFVLAVSGLFISSWSLIGPFNPIHMFSVLVLWSIGKGLWHLRQREFVRHGAEMRGLYFQGLGAAGLFTFLPGRTLNDIFFPNAPVTGFILTFIVVATLAITGWQRSAKRA